MLNYDKIKLYYTTGVWTKLMVQKAVEKQVITQEQYLTIIGEVEANA